MFTPSLSNWAWPITWSIAWPVAWPIKKATVTTRSPDPLLAIVSIINSSTKELQALYALNGSRPPRLDEPLTGGASSYTGHVAELSELIVAAANQLIATVRDPKEVLWENVTSMYMSAALGFVVDVDIPDVLNEAPNQALHVRDIASAVDCNEAYVVRVLRYLASRHVFREVTPNVFANNRLSSALVKRNGKTVAELKAEPMDKFTDAGYAALIAQNAGEALKSSTAIGDFLKSGGNAGATPFNVAWGTDKPLWEWYQLPENAWRYKRFNSAMEGLKLFFNDQVFLDAYDWSSLKSTDVAVDIAGGVGPVTLAISKQFPELKFVLEELPPVIEDAKKFWNTNNPEAIASGRITLQAHDIFQPQPIKGAAVYFMRFVLHNWPDSDCIRILKQIRDAASSSSKLIIFESGCAYACEDTTEYDAKVEKRSAPWPLIPNLGKDGGGPVLTSSDMQLSVIQMMTMLNGRSRTIENFIELGNATGWKLESAKNDALSVITFCAV
ncbi:hypothetical protein NP233_g6405 [Leucocoprinus birnbaumii]|uniref:S-adenosyl-L-methionine-dependent methyltransferase n=1 Tax=Leucocoprinus birnbaumii TaxID=56174 RepID=A0AAD5VUK6_9AGAR|nr:hypothetical protein NP233_g6405 [Leucocoprinus birnbaumii]